MQSFGTQGANILNIFCSPSVDLSLNESHSVNTIMHERFHFQVYVIEVGSAFFLVSFVHIGEKFLIFVTFGK